VLLNGHYGIPNWFFGKYRVAYWNKFKKPPEQPKYASMPAAVFPTWWIDQGAEAKISQEQQQQQQVKQQ